MGSETPRSCFLGSPVIDNFNALIHVRALLTDVFLIDEILNPHAPQAPRAQFIGGD